MANGITLNITDVFSEVKQRSQLKARFLGTPAFSVESLGRAEMKVEQSGPQNTEVGIVTDSDDTTLTLFLDNAVMDIANYLGNIGSLIATDTLIIHKFSTDQQTEGWEKVKNIFNRVIVFYLLWKWYEAIGINSFTEEFKDLFEKNVEKYRFNTLQSSIIQPPYRPYF